jgi:hypothetical protein
MVHSGHIEHKDAKPVRTMDSLEYILYVFTRTEVMKYKKTASFTDIHWGAKTNSELHNQDCERFIDWFCEQVRSDPEIDHIIFMGDWYENRSALNISTLTYSHRGASKLSALGLPVFFIIGNHDLYHRHTREIYSPITFKHLPNFVIVDNPVVVPEIGTGALLSPYLFPEEYEGLDQHLKLSTWWGHFEFKGFVITGYNVVMPTGPDPVKYAGPDHIFSGHFHQRQTQGNITYIGNAFPSNFGDANDFVRGMAIYDHAKKKLSFKDWADCPKYVRVKLTKMLDEDYVLPANARVKCVLDADLTFEQSTAIREEYTEKFTLREFALEETNELDDVLSNTESSATDDVGEMAEISDVNTVNQLVIQMLADIKSDKIDSAVLVEQYKRLV